LQYRHRPQSAADFGGVLRTDGRAQALRGGSGNGGVRRLGGGDDRPPNGKTLS
jgi:hypothetical protein